MLLLFAAKIRFDIRHSFPLCDLSSHTRKGLPFFFGFIHSGGIAVGVKVFRNSRLWDSCAHLLIGTKDYIKVKIFLVIVPGDIFLKMRDYFEMFQNRNRIFHI